MKARKRLYWTVGACAAAVVVSLGLSAVTFVRQSQADTIRRADQKTQDAQAVSACYQKIDRAPQTIQLLQAVDIGFLNTLESTRNALRLQPRSPLNPRRRESLANLERAHSLVLAYVAQVKRDTPSRTTCRQMAAELEVDPRPYEKGATTQ